MNQLLASLSPLEVLTAMITPAVLISACGTLILSTSQRLGRVVTRVRELSMQVENLSRGTKDELVTLRMTVIFDQLGRQARRARLLQRSLNMFYMAVGIFVITSFAIGITGAIGLTKYPWVPATLGIVGLGFLCYGSALMVLEARLALRTIHKEMDFMLELGRRFVPHEILERTNATLRGEKNASDK